MIVIRIWTRCEGAMGAYRIQVIDHRFTEGHSELDKAALAEIDGAPGAVVPGQSFSVPI